MVDFPASISLSSLNGTNGFRLDGTAAGWLGSGVSSLGDVNGDGIDDIIIGAPEEDKNGINNSGSAYVIFGKTGGFTASFDVATLDGSNGFRIDGAIGSALLGAFVSDAGDVNGDGIADILIGAYGVLSEGEAYVLFGSDQGFDATVSTADLDGQNGFTMGGTSSADYLGRTVTTIGDFNGDGIDDIAVGASGGGDDTGAIFVVFGTDQGFDASIDVMNDLDGSNGFRIDGSTSFGLIPQIGQIMDGGGDINGDGLDDLIFGHSANKAVVVFGSDDPMPMALLSDEISGASGFVLSAPSGILGLGWSVEIEGDVNSDGLDDIVVSAAGKTYVIFGQQNGFANGFDLSTIDGSNGFIIDGAGFDTTAGSDVSTAGDVNGDGFDDIIVAADGTTSGAVYVVFGGANGFATTINLSSLNGDNGFRIGPDDITGQQIHRMVVSAAGDINNDGFDDIIVGQQDTDGFNGSAYVLFGRAPTAAVTRTGSEIGQTIRGGAFNDTLRGLGGDDMLFGANGNDTLDGGTANDTTNGGAGNDTHVINSATDKIVDSSGADDRVQTSAFALNLTLSRFNGMENATLTGSGNFALTGDQAANELVGNSGRNTIDGGDGADVMKGGAGADIYKVDDRRDQIVESGAGDNRVETSVDFTLANGIEDIKAVGAAAIDLTGNTLANALTGNDASNTLDGEQGADTMAGGLGRDTYIVDNTRDRVVETGAGDDLVRTSATFTLSANVEDMIATGNRDIALTGNTLANELTGNGGRNEIDGKSGNDRLKGGGAVDVFVFSTGGDRDIILDFDATGTPHDVINLRGLRSVTSFADLIDNHMRQAGANVVIDGGSGDVLTINGVRLAQLDKGDFLL